MRDDVLNAPQPVPGAPSPDTSIQAKGAWVDRSGSVAALIAGFTLLRLLLAAVVPLLPQEAYYWTWSRHLDWSYFDHPPLASYSIALTTALFGQTVFGIKSAAVLWSLGWNLLWARLILDMFGSRRLAFWSLLALNLTLVYEAFGVGPTPDAPLLFAWVGTVWAIWRACAGADARWWYAAGVFAGLGMLGKYTAVLLLPIAFIVLLSSARHRHWLRTPHPYLAMLLATAIFTPVIYWNAQHDWASFAFQGSHRAGQMHAFKPRYFFALLGTQFLVVTPYLFVVCIAALWRGARDWRASRLDDASRLLLISAAVPLVLFSLVSLRSLVKINWLAPAYWPLIILAARSWTASPWPSRRVLAGLASSATVVLVALSVSAVPNLPYLGDLNSWSGWREAALRVDRLASSLRAQGQASFVFSPNYKISSLLHFYLPGQERTYAQDIFGARALQYDYFARDADLAGQTGILVISNQENAQLDLKRLAPYFDSVERVDEIETKAFGRVTRRIDIYRCTNYKGHPRLDASAEAAEPAD